jgi:spermidine synthase
MQDVIPPDLPGPEMISLDTVESPFGTIKVFRRRSTGTITYEQGGCCQSEADADGISVASYIHAIFGLILQTRARRILLIGCAGGTLATMLVRSGCAVTIVDVNPTSFVLARKHFALPESAVCQVADGETYLRSDNRVYDAIVLDAFHGAHSPDHLRSIRFYGLVRRHLTLSGAVFTNIHVSNDLDNHAIRVAERMSDIFLDVRLLDSVGVCGRNAIAMAGAVSQLTPPGILLEPAVERATIEAELQTMKFRPWQQAR